MARLGRMFFQSGARKTRAWLQFLLGLLQIIGATSGLWLLSAEGVSKPTVILAGATLVIMLVSRLVFSRS